MGFAESMTAGDQCDSLFVIHRHAAEGFADVPGRRERIRVAVRAFRVHVDETHLLGGERGLQIAIAGVAPIRQPLAFGAPVDGLVGLPDILAPAAEAERLEAHRLEGDVARKNHEVGPGAVRPYFCLIGHSSRRALSRLVWSGQLLTGAKRGWPAPAPPRPSPVR